MPAAECGDIAAAACAATWVAAAGRAVTRAVPARPGTAPRAARATAPAAVRAVAPANRGGNHGGWNKGGHHGGWDKGGKDWNKGGKHWNWDKGGKRHFNFKRIDRGGFVSSFFWGGQFNVGNWGDYGFYAPRDGSRWIRYYDDALLIDSHGRVLDGRYGVDWDRYGGEWDYEGEAPYRRDYADRGPPPGYDYDGPPPRDDVGPPPGYRHGPPPHGYPPPPPVSCANPCVRTYTMHGGHGAPPPPPYGHGTGHSYSYGHGCGTCGPIVVTETIVTTAPVVEKRVYTTYETRWVKAKPKPRKVYRRPAPPPPGERG